MLWLMLIGAYEVALPEGGEAVVDLVIENQTDTLLKEPWIFVFSKPDWLSVSPDSVITRNLARGEKVELRLKIKSEPPWFPGLREGTLRLRILVRNGEVAPDFVEFKVKEEPYEVASLVPWLLAREYTFTHTLTEHYDYYPIIFLHGNNATCRSWLEPDFEHEFDDYTALEKLLDSQYRMYEAADLDCYYGENLPSKFDRPWPKRQVYSVSYYRREYEDPKTRKERPQGVIGSNNTYWPTDPEECEAYRDLVWKGQYCRRVEDIINKVLKATYSDKVHIVAHCMGGLVLRASIKYCGIGDKINRVLMLATPNQGLKYVEWQEWLAILACPSWMIPGELAEMKLRDTEIFNENCGDEGWGLYWIEFLNEDSWPGSVKYATIGGLLNNRIAGVGPSDGLIDAGWVRWGPATFNATHYSSHSSVKGDGFWTAGRSGEASMIANEFTTEYIKTWIIDGEETRVGAVSIEGTDLPRIWHYTQEPLKIGIETPDISRIISVEILINFGGMFITAGGASYRKAEEQGNGWYYFEVIPKGYYGYTPQQYGAKLVIYTLEGIVYETTWGIGIAQ